ATLVVGAAGLMVAAGFFAVSDVDAIVTHRAREVSTAIQGRDHNFAWRVQKWRGAAAMVAQRPLWGWGTGQFVLHQYAYTHISSYPKTDPRTERAEIRRYGASFDDMA